MERSVFLVEDEAALRGLLASHLRKRGHRVLEAGDAEGAVRHLVQEPPFDLLITDVHLPNLSGIELLRLLQAHSPMKPVLVITGDDDDAIAREAIERGAAGYLLKPFQLSELDAAVAQAFRHLELIERVGEEGRRSPRASELGVPVEWLDVAEARSGGAGIGHGRRVQRLATVLANRSGLDLDGLDGLDDLGAAARLHEIGRLIGSADAEARVPALSATLLEHTTVAPPVRELIAGMSRWEEPSSGNGAGLDLSMILAAADRIDHTAMARVAEGDFPPTAIMAALEEVTQAVRRDLGSEAGAVLSDAREVLSAIWILSRGGYPSMPPRDGSETRPGSARGTGA